MISVKRWKLYARFSIAMKDKFKKFQTAKFYDVKSSPLSMLFLSNDLLHSSPSRWWRWCAVVGGGWGARGWRGDMRGGGARGLPKWWGWVEGRKGWWSG